MPPSSSVISGEKLIDELEHKLEAPLVPKGHPNTHTDQDSDSSNHILKDQEPETESAKSNGNGSDHKSEDVEGRGSYLILQKELTAYQIFLIPMCLMP